MVGRRWPRLACTSSPRREEGRHDLVSVHPRPIPDTCSPHGVQSTATELSPRWGDNWTPGEETPVAIILCAGKKRETVEYLDLDERGIHVAEYLTELPPEGGTPRATPPGADCSAPPARGDSARRRSGCRAAGARTVTIATPRPEHEA